MTSINLDFDEASGTAVSQPAKAYRVHVGRQDKQIPTRMEIYEVLRQLLDARTRARLKKGKQLPVQRQYQVNPALVEPPVELTDTEYVVCVERSDGAPLLASEMDTAIMLWMLNAKPSMQVDPMDDESPPDPTVETETGEDETRLAPAIFINPDVYQKLRSLPRECAMAWHDAMAQLQPDNEVHVKKLGDTASALVLVGVGLLARADVDGRYVVNRKYAHCTFANPIPLDTGRGESSIPA